MKKILSILIVCCLCLGTITVSADELSVYQYRSIYLNFAGVADGAGVGEYINCLNKEIDGMIMLDLNEDNVPELLTYVKEETVYNEDMKILSSGDADYDNPYFVDAEYYLQDALAIVDGNVVSSSPWLGAEKDKGMPMAYLPDEVPQMETELATIVTTCDGVPCLFSFTTGETPFNILTYQNNVFAYKSETNFDLSSRLGDGRGVAVSVEFPQYANKYDQLFILLDKYETAINKSNPDHTVVTSDWAKDEINTAIQSGLLPEKMFYDNLSYVVTRGEFAACVVNMYEKKYGKVELPETEIAFTDIKNHKYEEEIKKAYYLGITNGIATGLSENTFYPDINIEREDIATMFCRAFKKANWQDWTLETDYKFALDYFGAPAFADDERISHYAKPSVYFMAKNGIVKGIGQNRFAPNWCEDGTGFATRQEVVIMALRFFNCTFVGTDTVNYSDTIIKYVKDNYPLFKDGFMVTDLNKDAIPELFSLRTSNEKVVARFYEFKDGYVNDSTTEFIVSNNIKDFAKGASKYFSPINYCDVYCNINTFENNLVCSYSDDSESIIVDNVYYAYRVLNAVSYDGRKLNIEETRVPANEENVIGELEYSDFMYVEDTPYIQVFGQDASIEDIERGIKNALDIFNTAALIPNAPNGAAEYYVKDIAYDFSMDLISKYYISYEEYIASKENGTPIVINGKSYYVKYDEHMYLEFGEAELVGEAGESYWFTVPKKGDVSEVNHFYGLPTVYAEISPDIKITLLGGLDTEVYPMDKILNTRKYRCGGNGYKVTIENNVITEMEEIYRP
ncbi:MAG: S-layer homology domain-containing protein [Clostridia bacterium]|nr:S-layer homology domain-containing protein [Clostridia bacterium]